MICMTEKNERTAILRSFTLNKIFNSITDNIYFSIDKFLIYDKIYVVKR